jgi:hypothetical protein
MQELFSSYIDRLPLILNEFVEMLPPDNLPKNIPKCGICLFSNNSEHFYIGRSIAEVFYGGIPENIVDEVYKRLNDNLLSVTGDFIKKYRKIFTL